VDRVRGIDPNTFLQILSTCDLDRLVLGGTVYSGINTKIADENCWDRIVDLARDSSICNGVKIPPHGRSILVYDKFRFNWNVGTESRRAFLDGVSSIVLDYENEIRTSVADVTRPLD